MPLYNASCWQGGFMIEIVSLNQSSISAIRRVDSCVVHDRLKFLYAVDMDGRDQCFKTSLGLRYDNEISREKLPAKLARLQGTPKK